MAYHYSPKIVTNGLIYYADFANTKSYPGSGVSVFDLSENRIDGTLTNGPTFDTGNYGNIVFDGVDDYVSCGNSEILQINEGSACTWVKTSGAGSDYRGIITKQYNWGLFLLYDVLVTYDWGNGVFRSTGINIADGSWNHVALTFTDNTGVPSNNAKVYLNGSEVLTATVQYSNNSVEVQIAEGGGGLQALNGSIGSAQIYNRVLSPFEISQNFLAMKKRFGL